MLRALGTALEQQGAEPVDIVVCGGMALILQGIVDRRTRDIDALGLVVEENGVLVLRKPFMGPDFQAAVERIGTVYGEGKHWLSFAARILHDTKLPDDLIERAEMRRYGTRLKVRLCSRYDMIHLKMWGAVNRGARDIEDLVEIRTTEAEAGAAAAWCLSEGCQRSTLLIVLERIGHGELAKRLD